MKYLVVALLLAAAPALAQEAACPEDLRLFSGEVFDLGSTLDQMAETGLIDDPEYRTWLAWLTERNGSQRGILESAPAETCIDRGREAWHSLDDLREFIAQRRNGVRPMQMR
ncbi:hypothetical protein JCM17960_09030 [Magnetospira thiophila]